MIYGEGFGTHYLWRNKTKGINLNFWEGLETKGQPQPQEQYVIKPQEILWTPKAQGPSLHGQCYIPGMGSGTPVGKLLVWVLGLVQTCILSLQ